MNEPPGGSSGRLWKRAVWLIVVAALVSTMVAIYLFLLPSPTLLAEAEEFELEAGAQHVIEPLPMGGRYLLRACDHATELRADIGNWSSDWIRLPVNPMDLSARDLRIDGRAGGTLRIQARTPTGRLVLFRSRRKATCRGEDPQDLDYVNRRVSNQLPPFDCDESTLSRYDREALELLQAEFLARHGSPVVKPLLKRLSATKWYKANPHFQESSLSEDERACLGRLRALAEQAPKPGALPEFERTPSPEELEEEGQEDQSAGHHL